jgi:spore coat polysaccharide biosynthesis protein SpsF
VSTAAIVPARMASAGFPGKVLAKINGRPMLWYVLQRVWLADSLETVIVATGAGAEDDAIADFCWAESVDYIRGPGQDVLDTCCQAASSRGVDRIVTARAECPLVDPWLVDRAVGELIRGGCDYVTNRCPPTWPMGLEVDALTCEALHRASSEAPAGEMRWDPSSWARSRPEEYVRVNLSSREPSPELRWTVDAPGDLERVQWIFRTLGSWEFSAEDVLDLLEEHQDRREAMAGTGEGSLPRAGEAS